MKLFDGKDQIPIFAPYDVAVVNGKLFEFLFIEILVILGVQFVSSKHYFAACAETYFWLGLLGFPITSGSSNPAATKSVIYLLTARA